jgi:hypothetical protein
MGRKCTRFCHKPCYPFIIGKKRDGANSPKMQKLALGRGSLPETTNNMHKTVRFSHKNTSVGEVIRVHEQELGSGTERSARMHHQYAVAVAQGSGALNRNVPPPSEYDDEDEDDNEPPPLLPSGTCCSRDLHFRNNCA